MKNNSKLQFWLFSLSLIALRCADVAVTYAVTPDLRWEINPLVSVAGLGWRALILANAAGVSLVIALLYYSTSQPHARTQLSPGYSLRQFVSHYLFGDPHSFRKIYYVVPHNRIAIVHYAAYVFVRVLTLWSFVVVLHNVLVWYSPEFRIWMAGAKLWLLVYALLVLLVPVFSLSFFLTLYRQYCAAIQHQKSQAKAGPPPPGGP